MQDVQSGLSPMAADIYALHFPMAKCVHLSGMSDERWRSFFAVDVLQCIAVMLTFLQGLGWLARIRGAMQARRHSAALRLSS